MTDKITDEMVREVAWLMAYDSGLYPDDARNGKPLWRYYESSAKAALTAAYPLIRAQVLEEAAGVCDMVRERKLKQNRKYEEARYTETAAVCLAMASSVASCAAAIRELKGDV